MKTNIVWLLLAGALIFNTVAALILAGCDSPTDPTPTGKPEDQPKPQTGTANFGSNLSTTVEGTYKDSEWDSVRLTVENALIGRYVNKPGYFNFFLLNNRQAVIILEENEEYKNSR